MISQNETGDSAGTSDSAGPQVPLFATKYANGWPGKPDNEVVVAYAPLADVLTASLSTDAHFAAYSAPSVERRLDGDAPAALGGVPMVAAVFDVDGPGHACPDVWWSAEKEKLARLAARHPGAFAYRTRGGYRVVYRLAAPVLIVDGSSAAAWTALYRGWRRYLAREFGVEADASCGDWQHLFRLPHATRDEGGGPEELETLGDPAAVGPWSPELSEADVAEAPHSAAEVDLADDDALVGDYMGFSLSRRAELAAQHLAKLPPSIAGQSGDARLFDAAVAAVRGHALPSGTALEVLRGFNGRCVPPWDEGRLSYKVDEATRSTKDQGYMLLGHGLKVAMAAKERAARPTMGADDTMTEDAPEDGAPINTDVGNAARFAEQHSNSLRYLEDRKVWLRWDGRRWLTASDTYVTAAGMRTAKKIHENAFGQGGDAMKHAVRSASSAGIAAMVRLAAATRVFGASADKLDRGADLLNVLNGTLDLRTGTLRPHDRADLLTTLTEVAYDPAAPCPRWERFLREVFLGDEDLIAFMQRAVGYSLTGHTREQAFFVLHGGGRNGKGRFVRQLMALLGDAARTTRFATFTVGRESSDGNTPALAALAGARLVSAGEPDAGVRFSESTIKQLTGEDEIQACAKFEAPFTFTPRFKVWLHCNHRPEIRGTDEGIWRRPRLVPFSASFEGDRADPELDAKLDAERAGILAWAVRGAAAWYARGLGSCEAVRAATAEYRAESDALGPFLEERVCRSRGSFLPNSALRQAYTDWCERNGEEPVDARQLGHRMSGLGYAKGKRGGERGWQEAALAKAAQPWPRQPGKVLPLSGEQPAAVEAPRKGQ